jgi:CBS domain-containing protein
VQGMTLELESGFGQVSERLDTGLGQMNDNLKMLTRAVRDIRPTFGVAALILQVKIQVFLPEAWEPIFCFPGDSVKVANQKILEHDVRTLLFLNPKGQNVVGMTTQSLLLAAVRDGYHEDAVREPYMVPRGAFHCIDQSGPLAEALKLFRHHRVKRLFVTDGKRTVVGILTLGMCLRWMAERLVEHSSAQG